MRNGVKYCKVLKLPEVLISSIVHFPAEFIFTFLDDTFFLLLFFCHMICADSVHSPEALPARGDVLLQDQQPRFLPSGGPQHAALPGQGQPLSGHHVRPAVSHLSPRHGRKYEMRPFPADTAVRARALARADVRVSAPSGGHYIAYCQNVINGQWYEFDDQYVTEVHETVVQNAEAYVLFYR